MRQFAQQSIAVGRASAEMVLELNGSIQPLVNPLDRFQALWQNIGQYDAAGMPEGRISRRHINADSDGSATRAQTKHIAFAPGPVARAAQGTPERRPPCRSHRRRQ